MHQPVGNSFEVIQKAVNECYFPFFNTIKDFNFKFAFHSSGWILEIIKNDFPKLFEIIKNLAQKGNIEFFTGGFYEPILPIIPSSDRLVQIKKLNNFLFENFGVKPKGLWLTERVWDYSILKDIVKSGIEYIMVDDFHLQASGYEEIEGYYITENEGEILKLIPISQELRYSIPFDELSSSIAKITSKKYAIMFDDLEKFGMWPNSYEWCYKKNWLKKFFAKMEKLSIHFQDFISNTKPISLAYIQNLSYPEMQKWCLKADKYIKYKDNQYFKGCIWKNFFNKYPESNYLHKRMLEISKQKKSENLYKLQDNDVFWHGVFGGIYLGILRENSYKYLLLAEKEIDRKNLTIKDIDLDGYDEIIVKNNKFFILFNHKGEIVEFSDLISLNNYQNMVSRKKEGYFFEAPKKKKNNGLASIHEISLDKPDDLIFDRYLRYSFIVYEIFEDFSKTTFFEDNFTKKEISFNYTDKLNFISDEVTKKFKINEKLFFEITTNKKIAIELNFYGEHINKEDFFSNKIILDNLIIQLDKPCQIFAFELFTYSKTEMGYQKEFQGVSISIITNKTIKGYIDVRD